jgi:8-oxo-dGTP pyrophosphatase MutT (NUDIX family)
MEKPEEKTLFLATLVFPIRYESRDTKQERQVMLATKVKKIGAGCLNGWGGGVEEGESLLKSAAREFGEETGASISSEDLEKIGIVHFTNHKSDGSVFVCTVHVYTVSKWNGEIHSTEEMDDPKWYTVDTIPFERLMLADLYWLPRMLNGEKGIAWAEYGAYQKTLIGEVKFETVSGFEEE